MVLAPALFPNRLGALGLHGMTATFGNTGYMGIPLMLIVFGEDGMLPGIISTVLNGTLVIMLATALLEIDFSRGKGIWRVTLKVLGSMFASPLVMAALGGLALSALDWEMPLPLATFCDLLGAAAGPCALFAIGLFMVDKPVTAGLDRGCLAGDPEAAPLARPHLGFWPIMFLPCRPPWPPPQ